MNVAASSVLQTSGMPQEELAECIFKAAQRYKLSPALMLGLVAAERGQVGQSMLSPAGGNDLGLMRLNSGWAQQFAGQWGVDGAAAEKLLQDDGCLGVQTAAWLLHAAVEKGTLAEAIALYRTAAHRLTSQTLNPPEEKQYVARVLQMAETYKDISQPADILPQGR